MVQFVFTVHCNSYECLFRDEHASRLFAPSPAQPWGVLGEQLLISKPPNPAPRTGRQRSELPATSTSTRPGRQRAELGRAGRGRARSEACVRSCVCVYTLLSGHRLGAGQKFPRFKFGGGRQGEDGSVRTGSISAGVRELLAGSGPTVIELG